MAITNLPDREKDKRQANLELLKRELPYFLEMASVVAKVRRKMYLECIEAGFTEAQALELAKSGISL